MSQEVSIFRIFSNGVRYRFLDFTTVTYMSVMESRALVFVATAYAIHAYRLTSTHSKTYVATLWTALHDPSRVYTCVTGSCGEVAGLAAGDSGQLFYLLRSENGTTQLYTYNIDQDSGVLLATAESFPS